MAEYPSGMPTMTASRDVAPKGDRAWLESPDCIEPFASIWGGSVSVGEEGTLSACSAAESEPSTDSCCGADTDIFGGLGVMTFALTGSNIADFVLLAVFSVLLEHVNAPPPPPVSEPQARDK